MLEIQQKNFDKDQSQRKYKMFSIIYMNFAAILFFFFFLVRETVVN